MIRAELKSRITGILMKLLNKFLSLHILMINHVINLPTVSSSGYSELSEWSEPKIGWSGGRALSGHCRKMMEWSGSGRGAGTERRAGVITDIDLSLERVFAAHAPLTCSGSGT